MENKEKIEPKNKHEKHETKSAEKKEHVAGKMKGKGMDWSKDNVYDAIGRPDLKKKAKKYFGRIK